MGKPGELGMSVEARELLREWLVAARRLMSTSDGSPLTVERLTMAVSRLAEVLEEVVSRLP